MSNLFKHYTDIGNRYDRQYQKLFGPHRMHVVRYIFDHVVGSQKSELTICDVGGGTGSTLDLLRTMLGPSNTYILVEPSGDMLAQAKSRIQPPDRLIRASAEEFVRRHDYDNAIDIMLCQEMIHHVHPLTPFFEGACRILKEGGRLLIITRPLEVDFPFGKHAKKAWRDSYALDPEEFPALLRQAGFRVQEETLSLPLEIDKTSWSVMIGREPIFSNIALLSEKQREEDLKEIQVKDDVLKFNDNLIFILATKQAGSDIS